MSATPESQRHPETLAALFADLDGGVFEAKAMAAMQAAALGSVITGKKAKVTLTFEFKRIGESAQVEMRHSQAFTRPTKNGETTEKDTTSTPLHVGAGGKITLLPDTQMPMFNEDGSRRSNQDSKAS
jgi:hypothetical protein